MESLPVKNTAHKGFWPALTLFFLAPAIGELLSGSAPPAEFFNPFGLLLLGLLYGGGAILIHELRVRWGKGWRTVFMLGAAYGIIEEGLMCKSFFDPNWMDLGILGTYGRWAGVNWVWSLELTIYHAIFSISIPILLVELLFPAQRDERWLGRRGMIVMPILFAADVIFGFLFLTPYRPPVLPFLLACVVIALLILWAKRLPSPEPAAGGNSLAKKLPRLRWFTLVGLVATLAFFFFNWGLPNLNLPVPVTMLLVIVLAGLVWLVLRHMSRRGAWGDKHHLALAAGALGFLIILAPLQELDKTRLDNTSGMALVGLAFLLLLAWLWRQTGRPSRPINQPTLAT